MKKIIMFLMFIAPIAAFAQNTTSPDTVCYQTAGSIYTLPNTAGYTYTWTVAAPGALTSGQGTNSINVDWSAANPGLIANAISVFATSADGCTSVPVVLDVFILNIVPTLTAIGPYCADEPCVALTATPLGGTWTGPGVVGNTFCAGTSGSGTFTLTYTITEAGCTFSGTTPVTVNPIPVLTPIQHN
jgi:hypothetical protein